MNQELEALVVAFDAWTSARSRADIERLKSIYDSRLEDVLARCPGLSKDNLMRAIDRQHRRWLRAQQTPPSLPPKA